MNRAGFSTSCPLLVVVTAVWSLSTDDSTSTDFFFVNTRRFRSFPNCPNHGSVSASNSLHFDNLCHETFQGLLLLSPLTLITALISVKDSTTNGPLLVT